MSTERREPLDEDERALARVLRALPTGEPPSALDARILAAARDAVVATHESPRVQRRRSSRLGWGLGLAASCVMAAGLVWRLGGFGMDAVESAAAPAGLNAPMAAAPAAPMAESVPVDFAARTEREADSALQVAPPPPAEQRRQAPAQNRADVARERVASEEAQRKESAPEPAAFAAAPAASPPPMAMAAPAPAAAENMVADEAESLDRITVFGSRIALADVPITEDARLGPDQWLERIAARIAEGDKAGARASLQRFERQFPRTPLPAEIAAFRESP